MITTLATPASPKDCSYFGKEIPNGKRCPPGCPLAQDCFAKYEGLSCLTCSEPATLETEYGPLCSSCGQAVAYGPTVKILAS